MQVNPALRRFLRRQRVVRQQRLPPHLRQREGAVARLDQEPVKPLRLRLARGPRQRLRPVVRRPRLRRGKHLERPPPTPHQRREQAKPEAQHRPPGEPAKRQRAQQAATARPARQQRQTPLVPRLPRLSQQRVVASRLKQNHFSGKLGPQRWQLRPKGGVG